MMISIALVLCLSTVSYRILKSAANTQLTSVESQKSSGVSQMAMERFKRDVARIDYNWVRFGVSGIYPAQGYELGTNYYTDETLNQSESLSDGVTFLTRDPSNDRVYEFTSDRRICFPEATSSIDINMYGPILKLTSVEGLEKDKWVMIYQAGHYALGVVSSTTVNGIKLRKPNDIEMQKTVTTSAGKSSGFVIQPGVVMASMDLDGASTKTVDDDNYCFDSATTRMQVLGSPVSYFVDYRTSDTQPKSLSNAYVLNSKGEKEKMLVRAEYSKGKVNREYIASVDTVGFTYDLLGEQNVDGTVGDIVRNIGQDKTSDELVALTQGLDSTADKFQNTYRIVALKMNLTTISPNRNNPLEDIKHTKEMKLALDPSFGDNSYQDSTTVVSSLTDTLTTLDAPSGVTYNEELGKPLYLVHGDSEEIMVPVSKFQVNSDGTLGEQSKGEIYVYNKDGCAANSNSGCDPTNNNSVIRFNPGSNTQFFPNTLVQTTLPNGYQRIFVGGVGVNTPPNSTGGASVVRKSMMGMIDLAPGEKLSEKLENPTSVGACNIAGCSLQTIDTSNSATSGLVDTANISVDAKDANKIYITTLTKTEGENSPTAIYKGDWNGSTYTFTKWGDIPLTDDSRLVTALSSKTITVGGEKMIAACISKKISASCGAEGCLTSRNGAVPSKTGLVMPFNAGSVQSANLSSSNTGTSFSGTSGAGTTGSGSTSSGSTGTSSSPGHGTFPSVGAPPSGSTTSGTTVGTGTSGTGTSGTTAGSTESDAYGSIMLLSKGSGTTTLKSLTLVQHNYGCTSLETDNGENLIVAGRLTNQPISSAVMQRAYSDPTFQALISQQVLYLDEIGLSNEENTYFADYYQVDPTTYDDPSNPQFIGWMTGTSVFEFADGTFGMVNANKFRLAAGYGINTSSSAKEFSNAGISQVSLAGMEDRVVAAIVTDPLNINNSEITATYALRSTDLPSVYIPGSFYINSENPRTEPTPLPAITPSMSDASWIEMYRQFLSSHGASGLNTEMPVFGSGMSKVDDCTTSFPNTCK